MEKSNVWEAEGHPLEGPNVGGEHKFLTSGKKVSALYYKIPFNPEKKVTDGAHGHLSESVMYVIDGDLEAYIAGETVFLKKGDLVLVPANACIGTRVLSGKFVELLICGDATVRGELERGEAYEGGCIVEKSNVWETKGEPLAAPNVGGEHKMLIKSGEKVHALYYKMPFNPQKDIMDGAHPHPTESVMYVIDGDLDVYVAGEKATLKKGDLIVVPADAVIGTKVLSGTFAELLIVGESTLSAASEEHNH
jgi:quercetin dioxygenase-like cupin family protein